MPPTPAENKIPPKLMIRPSLMIFFTPKSLINQRKTNQNNLEKRETLPFT